MTFKEEDFNIKTAQQNKKLRKKLNELGDSLVVYAKETCPNLIWDKYVTSKNNYKSQWGAVTPMAVSGFEEYLSWQPNIFYNLHQGSNKVWVAANVEFKLPRERLDFHISNYSDRLLSSIQNAKGATISILRKEVLKEDKRNYKWGDELWDADLPEIDVSQCTVDYLKKYKSKSEITVNHLDSNWEWQPIFLVRYEFKAYELINKNNVEEQLGEKVKYLSPIIEQLVE